MNRLFPLAPKDPAPTWTARPVDKPPLPSGLPILLAALLGEVSCLLLAPVPRILAQPLAACLLAPVCQPHSPAGLVRSPASPWLPYTHFGSCVCLCQLPPCSWVPVCLACWPLLPCLSPSCLLLAAVYRNTPPPTLLPARPTFLGPQATHGDR